MEGPNQSSPGRDPLPKLTLLQREYTRRAALAREDRTVAALRLREAAELLCRGEILLPGDAPEELFSPLRERYTAFLSPLLRDCASPLDGFALRKGLCDALAEVLAKQIPSGGENFFSARRDPQSGEEEGEKIAYFRNRFSDEAYDSVYAYLTSLPSPAGAAGGPLAVYTDSFSHAAELLSEGRCTAVLFPCETEDGHFLPSVEGLIREYDLKKTVVCPLSPKLGGASYALLRKSLCFTPACSHGEFRLPRNNETARALYELPLLAAADGLTVERAETLLSAGGKDAALRFLFRADGATGEGDGPGSPEGPREGGRKNPLLQMFFYLSMEFPDFTAGGFYRFLSLPESGGGEK